MQIKKFDSLCIKMLTVVIPRLQANSMLLFTFSEFFKFSIINMYCFYYKDVISNIYVNLKLFIQEKYSHEILKNM